MSNCSKNTFRRCNDMIRKHDTVCDICNRAYKQGRADEVDECIDVLNDSIPYSENADVIRGFYCAMEIVEQLKEQK